MKLTKPLSSLIVAALLGGGLAACGGGSSGSGTTPPPASGVEISGSAKSVGNSVAQFERHGALYALGNFLLPSAGAAITGLLPVQGATVELIYVDDKGVQIGAVLAETTTSLTGNYNLRLPEGVDLAANLVVRITGLSGSTLDAQVVSQTVNIDPYSDFLLDKLIANGTRLDTLAINEMVTLRGRLEAFDLTAGASLGDMLAALDAAAGTFVDTSIAKIESGAGVASEVVGDYHLGAFDIFLDDSDGNSGTRDVNRIGSSVELGSLSFADAGADDLAATMTYQLDANFNLSFYGNNGYLFVGSSVESEPEEETASVDGSGAISFEFDFEEEIIADWFGDDDGFGFRYPAGILRFTPVADTGLYLARHDEVALRYKLADGAVDPAAKHGDEVSLGMLVLARKSEGLDASALSGDYGLVGMGLGAAHSVGETSAAAFYSVETFSGGTNSGTSSGTGYNAVLERSPGGFLSHAESTDTLPATYIVAADGSLTITDADATVTHGFVADGGNVLAVFAHGSEESGGSKVYAENAMAIGVKLPLATPDVAGRSYQLRNLMLGYDGTATAISSLSGGVLTFNSGATVTMSGTTVRGVERPNDSSDLLPIAASISEVFADQHVDIGTNGKITIAVAEGAERTLKLDGFVSADGQLLILRASYDDTDAGDVGIFIGSLR